MPPCIDVYVWVPHLEPELLRRFTDTYVLLDDPGDERFAAFERLYVEGPVRDEDRQALIELRPGYREDAAFSIYLRARNYESAVITVTSEDAIVLGLSLDDPDSSAEILDEAGRLLDRLRKEFSAPAGIAGTELPPPMSRIEWEEASTQLRAGSPGEES